MFKNIYLFLPGISEKYQSGGLRVALQTRSFFGEIFPESLCEIVTTHEKIDGALFASEFFAAEKMPGMKDKNNRTLCVVTWGPLVADHIKMIRKNLPNAEILFYAQSFGWGINVPVGIPIICVSRFVMSQWALYCKGNFVGYVPPSLSSNFSPTTSYKNDADNATDVDNREFDVLVHTRKQNRYCIEKLLPSLKKVGLKIHTIDSWIDQENFAALLKKSKVFLYVTELHKAGFLRRLPGEGFGLPALEAIASGCMVASNLLGGVTDFLTPGTNCVKVESGSLDKDVESISRAVANFKPVSQPTLLAEYSATNVKKMWTAILKNL